MSKPLWFRGETLPNLVRKAKQIKIIIKKSNILFFAISLVIFAGMTSLWDSQTVSYAHAYTGNPVDAKIQSPLLVEQENLFDNAIEKDKQTLAISEEFKKQTQFDGKIESGKFADKIYEIVGDSPIREMVPFISLRDEKVAAFLVGIAKKESSLGFASPSKDGKTCYNYWGYKGSGQRGTGMGYACFASPEEAIQVVGDRIEVLVNKDRNTPARMVDTWKCGKSCAGDPGASSWVSTVAFYFEKIVG
jgi:hypothetical protein